MKVKILPLGYVGRIVEQSEEFIIVRLHSGTRVICTFHMVAPF